jgi:hypothetical protein
LVADGEYGGGQVLTTFFSVVLGGFALGQIGTYLEGRVHIFAVN